MMRHRHLTARLAAILLVVSALSIVGCGKKYVAHPGAVNTFDSRAYDALLVAHDSIEQGKTALSNGTLPIGAKEYLNQVIKSYNVARDGYVAYHNAAATNPNLSTQQLQSDLDQLALDLASFIKKKGGAGI